MFLKSCPDARLSRRDLFLLLGISLLSVGIFLIWSGVYYRIGFPLDDAWIHQTYAQNLATHGEWAFVHGEKSGGSTAPLWSTLLALGFWLRIGPFAWAYILGTLFLWGLAVLGENLVRSLIPGYRPSFPWTGAALALEWHLVWAAGSGMEILLYCSLVILIFTLLIFNPKRFLTIGLLIGLSTWVRPDGITLLAPAALMILLTRANWSVRMRWLLELVLGFGGLFSLYLFFNLAVSGSTWPNTFYAKQAEYSINLQIPIVRRIGQQFLQPLIGMGVVLLPGMIWHLIVTFRNKNWGMLMSLVWAVGYCALYALMLPVTYQHGRYVIPAMPVFFIIGLAGLADISTRKLSPRVWALPVVLKMTTVLVLISFYIMGGVAYVRDVAVIESEMVTTAKWVAKNIPQEAIVAAHDIGALGYYGNHEIIDLAGLISPDVIPFIRDETALQGYLNLRGVNYLITFPDWYPMLVDDLTPIFSTNGEYATALGERNMSVYIWPGRP